jgi:regulatory protein
LAADSLRAQAIRLLARREYARSELRGKLLAKGAAAGEVESLLEELVGDGYLSDARLALETVARKSADFARRRIADSLRAKGIARADIETALAACAIDDAAALQALWQRRFGRRPVDERDLARQVRFLHGRGFAVSAILRLLREPEGGAES